MSSSDPIFYMWTTSVAIELVLCLSIVTACIPILKPLLESLESGQMRAKDMTTKGRSRAGYSSERVSQGNRSQTSKAAELKRTLISATPSNRSGFRELADIELTDYRETKNSTTATTQTIASSDRSDQAGWGTKRPSSQKGLIRQTVTWEVQSCKRDSTDLSDQIDIA